MDPIEKRRRFVQDGKTYTLVDSEFDPTGGPVQRFTYGQEPEVVAQIPVEEGGTVEVVGTAGHWNMKTVDVGWHDDNMSYFSCRVPAENVRRLERED